MGPSTHVRCSKGYNSRNVNGALVFSRHPLPNYRHDLDPDRKVEEMVHVDRVVLEEVESKIEQVERMVQ